MNDPIFKVIFLDVLFCLFLAVHDSGAIRGLTTDDSPHRCGSILCRPVTGSYTKPNLPNGYFFIVTIPEGAWNVSVSQPSISKNRLVLRAPNKRFIIDGEQGVTSNTTYVFTYQNNIFEYRRDSDFFETITTRGFLTRTVDLMILVKDKNPGVKYSYFIPTPSSNDQEDEDSVENGPQDYPDENKNEGEAGDEISNTSTNKTERRRPKFTWKLIGFGPCTRSCGGGYQPPIFRCVRDIATRFYTPRRCMHLDKPVFHEMVYRCNTKPCPSYWHIEDWGDCYCHNGKGFRERPVKCVQEQSSGAIVQVEDNSCKDEKPESRENCPCPRLIRKKVHIQRSERLQVYPYTQGTQSVSNRNETMNDDGGGGTVRRDVTSVSEAEKNEKTGSWLISEWSDHCSVECGIGVEHRSIFCDRSHPNTEPCDLRTTPDTTRFCESERNCDTGFWFTGRWSECSGDCFNLTKKREVFCVRDTVIVDELECLQFKKPDSLKNCSLEEVHYCKSRWYYSEWSPCSRSCGGGIQRRIARCLEPDLRENVLRDSKECRYSERHPIFSTCNNEKCPERVTNQRVDVIENDVDDPPCEDVFSNCHLIDKSRVCKLNYYNRNCCVTCSNR